MAIIIYCGVLHGALVRHTDASLAYGGWPLPFHDLAYHIQNDWVQLASYHGFIVCLRLL